MQDHLVKQHLVRIIHTHGDHGKTISNKNHIHPGMVGNMRTWEVMGGEDCDWFLPTIQTLYGLDGDRFACGGCCTQRGM